MAGDDPNKNNITPENTEQSIEGGRGEAPESALTLANEAAAELDKRQSSLPIFNEGGNRNTHTELPQVHLSEPENTRQGSGTQDTSSTAPEKEHAPQSQRSEQQAERPASQPKPEESSNGGNRAQSGSSSDPQGESLPASNEETQPAGTKKSHSGSEGESSPNESSDGSPSALTALLPQNNRKPADPKNSESGSINGIDNPRAAESIPNSPGQGSGILGGIASLAPELKKLLNGGSAAPADPAPAPGESQIPSITRPQTVPRSGSDGDSPSQIVDIKKSGSPVPDVGNAVNQTLTEVLTGVRAAVPPAPRGESGQNSSDNTNAPSPAPGHESGTQGMGGQVPDSKIKDLLTNGGGGSEQPRPVPDNPLQSPLPSLTRLVSDSGTQSPAPEKQLPPVIQNLLNQEQRTEPRVIETPRLDPKLDSRLDRIIDNHQDAPQDKDRPLTLLTQLQNTLDREARLAQPQPAVPTDREDRDREDKLHEQQLRQIFSGPITPPPAQNDGQDPPASRPTTSSNKLEMQALNDDRRPNVISQILNKVESTIEQKVQTLWNAISELKPANADAARVLSAGDRVPAATKQELPFLPSFMRAIDVSDLFRTSTDASKTAAFDPNNPNLTGARGKFVLGEAMSLKDLIAATKADIPPAMRGDAMLGIRPGVDGRLIGPDGKPILGADGKPIVAIDGKPILGPDGKPILGPDGKPIFADGKLVDGRVVGIKGAESVDGKIGDKQPTGKGLLPGEDFEDDDADRKDTKDKVSEGDDDGDLLGLVPCSDKIKDKKKDGKDGNKSAKDDDKKETEARRKYVVQIGDTLESIAEKIIGDRRFSVLLEMINRGFIRYHWEGAVRKAMLRVGQTIWLPTSNEVKVHRTLFFTKKDTTTNPQTGNLDDISLQERSYGTLPVLDVSDEDADESSIQKTVKANRRKGDKPTVLINFAPGSDSEVNPETGDTSTVVISETSNSNNSASEWVQIQEFLNRMRLAAETGRLINAQKEDTDTQELPLITDDSVDIKQLDDRNRIVIENSIVDEDEVFTARLEKQFAGEWRVIACYESSAGRAVRYLHKVNGGRRAFHLNIPDFVVREMALKDLSRNWKTYSTEYESIERNRNVKLAG